MANPILENLKAAITNGLNRQAMSVCSKYAERVRVMGMPFPGPWTFHYHPWLREMHDSTAMMNVCQKSAQAGFTETALNKTFFKIDICKTDCLYALPTKSPDASDFSSSRFDAALEASPYLKNLFSDVKNIGHKRAGSVNLYIRGSRSRAGFKSIPAGFLVLDELDEMDQDNISLVFERQSGQMVKERWLLSTPTIEDFGINKYFKKSSQEHFFFKCPHCNKLTELIYPDCLVVTAEDPDDPKINDSHIICKECKATLRHQEKTHFLKNGIWVPSTQITDVRGFYINQLYSSTVSPVEFAKSSLLSLASPSDEQEFYNSKVGTTHTVKDAKVLETDLANCISAHRNGSMHSGYNVVTMGVDVGKQIHVIISEWLMVSKGVDINYACQERILFIGKVKEFEELDTLIHRFSPHAVVIDANPERRKAFEVAQRYWGLVWLCFYGNNISGKYIHKGQNELEQTVTVDRTSWLDMSLGRFMKRTVMLPIDTPNEFKENIKALTRKPGKDKNGNPTATYINTVADHYGHAHNYAEIALAVTSKFGTSQNIVK